MSYFPHNPERDHENPSAIGRPPVRSAEMDEHDPPDPFSFESICEAAGLGPRERALRERNARLAASVEKAEAGREEGER